MKSGLYIVVRGDLPIGVQMAQIAHAAFEFAQTLAEHAGTNVYVLEAPDAMTLGGLVNEVFHAGIETLSVYEPDLGGALTAAAFPGAAAKLLKRLPLAGRQPPGAAASCGGAIPGPPGI